MTENCLLTIGAIRAARPYRSSWQKVLAANGDQEPADNIVVSLGDVAHLLGAQDAMWEIRALDFKNVVIRRKVVAVLLLSVKRAAKHTQDARVANCIAAVDAWVDGDATVDLHATARAAAWAEAEAAAEAAAWAEAATAWAARAEAEAWAEAEATAWAARAAERDQQQADIIAAFPLVYFADKVDAK